MGKDDSLNVVVRTENILGASTPGDVMAQWQPYMARQLDNCFDFYQKTFDKKAANITQNVVDKFPNNYPYDGSAPDNYCYENSRLQDITKAILQDNNRKMLPPDKFKELMAKWGLKELQKGVVDGRVEYSQNWRALLFSDMLDKAEVKNALAKAKNPSDTTYRELMTAWENAVKAINPNLDNKFFLPVRVDPEVLNDNRIFTYIRKYFKLPDSYISAGQEAVKDFIGHNEGPKADAFKRYLSPLLNKPAFRKFFYFANSGTDWSRGTLIVIDEHNQMFGMQIGYSK